MKKSMSLFLAVITLLSTLFCCNVTFAYDEYKEYKQGSGYTYQINDDGTITIVCCDDVFEGSTLIVPSYIDGKKVTKIQNLSFEKSYSKIVLPNTVEFINWLGDVECLESVNIPDSVKYINGSIFYKSPYCVNSKEDAVYIDDVLVAVKNTVERLTVKNGTRLIAGKAFLSCRYLESVSIPSSVTRICTSAFYDCNSLKSVTIPYSVVDMDGAFGECFSLESVNVNASNKYYTSNDGVVYDKQVTKIIYYPNGKKDAVYKIPSTVKTIDFGSINYTKIKNLFVPNSVTTIEYNAVRNNYYLESVRLGSNVKSIGSCAFFYNDSLQTIILPKSLKNIEQAAFEYCSKLKNVYYCGTSAEWKQIDIENDNKPLTDAKCQYNFNDTCAEAHKWNNGECVKVATKNENGTKKYICVVCAKTKNETIYKPTTYTLSTSTYTYDGKVKSPSITVKDSKGNTLKKDTDYTLTTPSGRKNVGTYTYKITFMGKYSGTATKSFKINPVKTSISKLTATSKGFKATWSKKSTQVTGYQIQYSTSSKFSSAKTVTVSSYKTTSKTVSKLTAKKKYYVRIRTYKTVSGTKYYSAWSSSKYITTKK